MEKPGIWLFVGPNYPANKDDRPEFSNTEPKKGEYSFKIKIEDVPILSGLARSEGMDGLSIFLEGVKELFILATGSKAKA